IQKRSNKIYVLLGDGEINEGSVWEAAMAASKHKLDNLIAMVDYNKVQSAGSVDSIMSMEPMLDKWTSFGFETIEVNGHDISELKEKLSLERTLSKPLAIICHTVKGKGINEAEGSPEWHYKRVDESLGENLIKQLKDAL
ncbi:thiamine pyrophosphate-dependent enzyme, partial [bacterium]|nr:thiamine pyrophosphate-dependent enzyme [bacterium]